MSVTIQINKLFTHLGNHSGKYLVILLIVFLTAGLWPFNFTEKNNAVISPAGGLEIARHGTAYTAVPSDKIHHLKQFTIHIDLVTSSNGLSSLEKIFGYFINQREMNFFVGQWKDGAILNLPDHRRQKELHFGVDGILNKEERVRLAVSYDGAMLVFYRDGKALRYRETGPLPFDNWSREYPLVVGTDAHGKSQWQGAIYEIAIYDRALTSEEAGRLSGQDNKPQAASRKPPGNAAERQEKKGIGLPEDKAIKQENPPVSPFFKGGGSGGGPFTKGGSGR